jgi:hypothetical protein
MIATQSKNLLVSAITSGQPGILIPALSRHFSKVNHSSGETYYDVLKVSEDASDEKIREAFVREGFYNHPEWHKGVGYEAKKEEFQKITESYYVLQD